MYGKHAAKGVDDDEGDGGPHAHQGHRMGQAEHQCMKKKTYTNLDCCIYLRDKQLQVS